MTSKRRRRRSRSASRGSSRAKASETQTATEEQPTAARKPSGRPGVAAEPPYPPLAVSVAQGLRTAGASPAILAVAFASLLASWVAYVILGTDPNPRTLALLMSIPPVQVFFYDAPVALSSDRSGWEAVVAVAGLAAVRGITFGLLILLLLDQLRTGRAALGEAVRRLPRTAAALAALYVVEFAFVVLAVQLLGQFLGQLAIFVIAAALYFLVFAPIIVADGDGPRVAVPRAYRAARLPGTRHLSLILLYFLLILYSGAVAPFGLFTPATPSIGAWAYGLVATFVHVSVLAAFAYRWLKVRDQVAAAPAKRRG